MTEKKVVRNCWYFMLKIENHRTKSYVDKNYSKYLQNFPTKIVVEVVDTQYCYQNFSLFNLNASTKYV